MWELKRLRIFEKMLQVHKNDSAGWVPDTGGAEKILEKGSNIMGCTEKPTTICLHEQATFGLCEKHFLEGKENGTMTLRLEFN